MVYGTKGTMQVDYEDRIDFTRMREYREGRIQKLLEKSDFSCLILFATENKRYATSTAVASPEVEVCHCPPRRQTLYFWIRLRGRQ